MIHTVCFVMLMLKISNALKHEFETCEAEMNDKNEYKVKGKDITVKCPFHETTGSSLQVSIQVFQFHGTRVEGKIVLKNNLTINRKGNAERDSEIFTVSQEEGIKLEESAESGSDDPEGREYAFAIAATCNLGTKCDCIFEDCFPAVKKDPRELKLPDETAFEAKHCFCHQSCSKGAHENGVEYSVEDKTLKILCPWGTKATDVEMQVLEHDDDGGHDHVKILDVTEGSADDKTWKVSAVSGIKAVEEIMGVEYMLTAQATCEKDDVETCRCDAEVCFSAETGADHKLKLPKHLVFMHEDCSCDKCLRDDLPANEGQQINEQTVYVYCPNGEEPKNHPTFTIIAVEEKEEKQHTHVITDLAREKITGTPNGWKINSKPGVKAHKDDGAADADTIKDSAMVSYGVKVAGLCTSPGRGRKCQCLMISCFEYEKATKVLKIPDELQLECECHGANYEAEDVEVEDSMTSTDFVSDADDS